MNSAHALILVAENDPHSRQFIELVFMNGDHQLEFVSKGRALLEFLQDHTPDLAIFDADAPELRCFDVADRMRRIKRLKDVPIIILTKEQDERIRTEALLVKAKAVLQKPCRSFELRRLVELALAESHLQSRRSEVFKTQLDMSPLAKDGPKP